MLYSLLLRAWLLYTLHISEVIEYLSFYIQLISFSVMSSRFIHVVEHGRISIFLRWNNIPLYVYTTFFFIHSSVSGHLVVCLSWLWWIVMWWTVNWRYLFEILMSVLFDNIPRSEVTVSHGALGLFLMNCKSYVYTQRLACCLPVCHVSFDYFVFWALQRFLIFR